MNIQIKHKTTGAVLYECNAPDLRAALEQAVREKASLAGASLDGASLVGARLDGASLDGARLDGARLDGAWLDGASLDGASLDGASLDGARLDGAWLNGARLDGAKLKDATISGDNAIVQIGPIGSRGATLIAFRTDKGLRLQTGCFYGDADTFLARVMETHGTNRHATNYRNALKLAASMLGCDQ